MLQFQFWRLVGNAALRLYMISPRQAIADELILIHRFAVKKAYNAKERFTND